MKVLHINCNYMGTALHQTMVEHLDRLGAENTVFAPVYSLENAVITPRENVVACKCFHKWDRIWFYRKQRKIQKALESEIAVGEFDLLHAYTLFTDGNCAYALSKKYNIPYVVAVRNTDVNTFFKWMPHLRSRGVEILTNAKAVFFLSEAYKKQVFNNYVPTALQGALEAKSYVIPNGIDVFWHENVQTKERKNCHNPVRLIFAGRIDANKNITTTQAAMRVLQDRGYHTHLTVVGKVADKTVFDRIVRDAHTTYIPPKDKSELIHIYRDNDIFVMPSHTESFGLVYAEAMSQGLPVIYTKGQGFDGQFPEGEVGYHVDDHSKEAVADGIERIVKSYGEISGRCLKNIERFRWMDICETYKSIYREICGAHNENK